MRKFSFHKKQQTVLGDMITPVQLYLKLRDEFPMALLLESSDASDPSNASSFICLNPVSEYLVENGKVTESYADGTKQVYALKGQELPEKFKSFCDRFEVLEENKASKESGLFGYCSWDAIPYFEKIKFKSEGNPASVPEFRYGFYQNVIKFNHYKNQITFTEYLHEGKTSKFNQVKSILEDKNFRIYPFSIEGNITSNVTDERYKEMVSLGKKACFRGDVFQIVPSRQFQQKFKGDDFNVYRTLRSINPSPYLFYFDYGNYKILGSSPESQLVIKDHKAHIDPIAGTVRRTGDDELDRKLTEQLVADPKENAEHVMLVDLARNDLSRNSKEVTVAEKDYKQIHYFSHVIHMVSRVKANLSPGINPHKVFADSFPAGTLSGAPKYRALELIDQMENQNRGVYGGALGFVGFDGDINTAITIRTFVSKSGSLYFQAGAGVVAASKEENELQEVNHKLGALVKAIEMADSLNNQ